MKGWIRTGVYIGEREPQQETTMHDPTTDIDPDSYNKDFWKRRPSFWARLIDRLIGWG